jgi:hypothetical protein
MTTSQTRAADIHAEPSFNLAANGSPADNLARLLNMKTPTRNALARRGVTRMPSMKATDDKIRSI